MPEVIVIGGGISGLTAAWNLKQAGLSVLVLEEQEQPGGNIKTLTEKGITSKQLTNHLWAGHSAESAKNNRSTQVQRIRETLTLNSGIHISYADKKWILELENDVYCDLASYIYLFEELRQKPSEEIDLGSI